MLEGKGCIHPYEPQCQKAFQAIKSEGSTSQGYLFGTLVRILRGCLLTYNQNYLLHLEFSRKQFRDFFNLYKHLYWLVYKTSLWFFNYYFTKTISNCLIGNQTLHNLLLSIIFYFPLYKISGSIEMASPEKDTLFKLYLFQYDQFHFHFF